jgi:hypothetical protein
MGVIERKTKWQVEELLKKERKKDCLVVSGKLLSALNGYMASELTEGWVMGKLLIRYVDEPNV